MNYFEAKKIGKRVGAAFKEDLKQTLSDVATPAKIALAGACLVSCLSEPVFAVNKADITGTRRLCKAGMGFLAATFNEKSDLLVSSGMLEQNLFGWGGIRIVAVVNKEKPVAATTISKLSSNGFNLALSGSWSNAKPLYAVSLDYQKDMFGGAVLYCSTNPEDVQFAVRAQAVKWLNGIVSYGTNKNSACFGVNINRQVNVEISYDTNDEFGLNISKSFKITDQAALIPTIESTVQDWKNGQITLKVIFVR